MGKVYALARAKVKGMHRPLNLNPLSGKRAGRCVVCFILLADPTLIPRPLTAGSVGYAAILTRERAINKSFAILIRFARFHHHPLPLAAQRNGGLSASAQLIVPQVFSAVLMHRCMPETKDRSPLHPRSTR